MPSPLCPSSPTSPTFSSPHAISDYDTAQDSDTPGRNRGSNSFTHGFSSDDESCPAKKTHRRRASCFESEGDGEYDRDSEKEKEDKEKDEKDGKEKGTIGSWKLWSKSVGNSTDEEIVPGRTRGLARKSKFRLRLFESRD